MKNKFSRSVTAIMLTAALLISSQGVVTAFADDENYSDASEYSSVQTTEVKGNETPSSNESDAEPEQKKCTCGAVDDNAHDESCPLYVKPDGGNTDGDNTEDDAAQCTCGAEEGGPHKEDCPLYVKPDGGNTNDGNTDNGAGEDTDIKSVVDAINALPAVEDLNEETNYEDLKALVASARAAYDALSEEQKAAFDTAVLDKLTALESGEQETAPSEAVQNVIEKIDVAVEQIDYTTETIPATDGTTVTKTHIRMLKDLDPANNAELKALIDKEAAHEQDENQPALTDEEAAKLSDARKVFEDAKAKYLSEGFSNAQLAARQAYDALATEEEKAQVTNYSLLTDMEANIAYIMQAVNTLPAEVKQPEVNYPSETSTVDYSKRQSDSVTYDGYEEVDGVFVFNYTIHEGAGSNIVIDLSQCALSLWENESQVPGDHFKFKILLKNESGNTYYYKDNSFVLAPEDTSEFGNTADGSLLPVLTYDGQLLPIQFTGAMIPYYFYKDVFGVKGSGDVTFEMMCQIYDYLADKGYTGESAITDYMLNYYNEKRNVNYESLTDLFADHPDWLDGNLVTNNGIWTMTEEELSEYIAKYPWINSFVSVKSSGNNLSVQIKWPEPEIAAVSYNSFYCGLFSVVYGEENAEYLNPNPSGDLEFSRAHGVGDYLSGTDLYQETNQYFSDLTANGFNTGDTLEIWSGYGIDGPGMGNSYQNYEFTYYNIIELEQPTPPVDPEDPTPTPDPDPDPTPRPGTGGDEDDDTPTIINETPVPTTTIEDEDVPMADLPEDTVTIDDEEVPLKDNPNTGDAFPVAAMAAAALSLGGVVALNRKKK